MNRANKAKRYLKTDVYAMLLDIVAVNASYYLALVLRFSINGQLDPLISKYINTTIYAAPCYSIICLFVFWLFKLYGGVWRNAGVEDLNRAILANLVTTAVYVAGTNIFMQRMPVTYYVMGAVMQLLFIVAIRFAHRIIRAERRTISKAKLARTLVIGTHSSGRQVISLLRMSVNYNTVAMIDVERRDVGELLGGVPVYSTDEFESVAVKDKIEAVIWAGVNGDVSVAEIREYCLANNIVFKDYTAFLNYYNEVDSFTDYASVGSASVSPDGKRSIPFSPPDISDSEIAEVVDTLRSGWITTGPRVKLLERRLAAYIETGKVDVYTEKDIHYWENKVVCLNSATAAEELNLRVLGIGPGDEVIVPAYTYTASASAAIHCGATVKFIDIQKDGDPITHMPEMDYDALEKAITPKTKAVILVDLSGIVCDYDRVFEIVDRKKELFSPVLSDGSPLSDLSARIQSALGRIAVVADCAHSLGGSRTVGGKKLFCGAIADFSSFSFHAVKNFTTAEGGASTWRPLEGVPDSDIYKMYQLLSLHGQNKDALAKTKVGAWEYDIVGPWYKCNMTDIMAAIGLRQLDRYAVMLERRTEIIARYDKVCDELGLSHLVHHTDTMDSSNHLYLVRVPGFDTDKRNALIQKLAEQGVSTNVHYKPLPMMTAYKALGWDIKDFPNTYDYYANLITLPLNTRMSDEDADYVADKLKEVMASL